MKKQKRQKYYPFLAAVLIMQVFQSCVETFEVPFVLDDSSVVVTGLITDQEPAYVKLNESAKNSLVRPNGLVKITGASVVLVDDQGTYEQLVEVRAGFYEGNNPGQAGRSYSVEITLPDDRQILSSPQVLKPSPSIDSLYLEPFASFQRFGSDVQVDFRGLDLNLYLNRQDTISRYYRWTVGGTYKFYGAYDTTGPCYYTFPELPSFKIGESSSLSADVIIETLKSITPNSTYVFGHMVELKQYSQTEESYAYWKKIDDQQNNLGSIFDPPPAQIVGNLSFVDENDGVVMGFFEVASQKTKRLFVTRDSFTNLDPNLPYFSDLGVNAPCYPPAGWIGPFIPPDFCFNCALLENSSRTKPDYWPGS